MPNPPIEIDISSGWDPDPRKSMSLRAEAYTQPEWFDADQSAIIGRTWQWICHGEKLSEHGSYVTATIAGMLLT